jgi:DNA-binding PucR family transcriptional regulator
MAATATSIVGTQEPMLEGGPGNGPRTLSEPGQAAAREIIGELGELEPGVGARMAYELRREIPELGTATDADEIFMETEASCTANVDQVIRMLAAGVAPEALIPPPAAIEYAQGLVRRNIPLAVLLRAYRIGHRFLWDTFARRLRAGIADEDELLSALEATSGFLFEYVDVVCASVVEAYQVERERWARTSAAVRAETVREILAEAPVDPHASSARLGYELARHHVGLILFGDARPDDGLRTLERQASEAAELLGCREPLLIPAGAGVLWAWCGSFRRPDHMAIAQLERLTPRKGVRIAVGRPGRGLEGFQVTHVEAQHAARFCRDGAAGSGLTTYRSVELVSLLAADVDRARRFVGTELGALAVSTPSAANLRETLLAFLSHGGSHVGAAHALNIHKNTVYGRVRRAEALLDVSVTERRVELQATLMLAALLGDEVLSSEGAEQP